MNPFVAFILGLLIGLLVEWIIDWVYWRRKNEGHQVAVFERSRSRVDELEQELASYKNQLASLQIEHARLETPLSPKTSNRSEISSPTPAEPYQKHDDLEIIVGIGPVIARTLNNAGVFTFTELSALTESELREIVGDRIQRIANEGQILSQAKQLAEKQNRGA